jgi:AcrR family transcriptional regulator
MGRTGMPLFVWRASFESIPANKCCSNERRHVNLPNMSWKHCGPGRRGYHHGNLREALIESALSLIGEKGPAGFTIAEAARSAGVSPAAPYRHFRDREELMAEVARLGFERFANDLEKAWHGGRPSPLEALQSVGRAYLAFARNEPAYYAAMFETGLPKALNAGLQESADRALDALYAATKKLVEKLPEDSRPPCQMVALHIWAMSHGIASLFGRGNAQTGSAISPEELLEAGVLLYLRGLGLAGGAAPAATL